MEMDRPLLADAETADEFRVAIRVLALEVIEQPTAPADEHEQPSTRVMILRVGLEMVCEVGDALGEQRHLHFGGSGITLDTLVFRNDVSFLLYGDWHFGFFSDDSKGDILA